MRKYFEAEQIDLVFSGRDYFDILERLVDDAKYTIHFQTYIFECDVTGMRIAQALRLAALRGVEVHLMVDAYGSFPFPTEIAEYIRASGIRFRLFSPLFSSENRFFGRRLHHKLLVADKRIGLLGGINVADKYFGGEEEPWLDYAVLVRGEVCEYLHLLCLKFYYKKSFASIRSWENS